MPGALSFLAAVAASTGAGVAVSSAVFVAIGTGSLTAAFIATAIGAIVSIGVSIGLSYAIGAVAGLLTSKPRPPGSSPIGQTARERTLAIKQPISSSRIIYGEIRVAGILTFVEATNDNDNLFQLLTISGHEIESFVEFSIDGKGVKMSISGSGETVESGPYAGKIKIYTGTGSVAGDSAFNTKLIAETQGWTANHRQAGHAKLCYEFIHDPSVFVGGTPAITARVKGKKLYDPRTTQTKYSNNPILAIYDYLINTNYGLGENSARINTDSFNAAANSCEEFIDVDVTREILPNYRHNEIVVVTNANGFKTGDVVQFSSTGDLPAPLLPLTDYYLIKNNEENSYFIASSRNQAFSNISINLTSNGNQTRTLTRQRKDTFTAETSGVVTLPEQMLGLSTGSCIYLSNAGGSLPGGLTFITGTCYYYIRLTDRTGKLATSYSNALAGSPVNITSAGTGVHTIHQYQEPRYTCNGAFDTGQSPKEILEQLLSSCGGALVYQAGKWNIYVDYQTPINTISENDLDGPIQIQTLISKRELFNGVKGVLSSQDHNFLPTDFPAVVNENYLAEDSNERIWKDIDLPYTTSASMAQRISKIQLEKARSQLGVVLSCKLSALIHQCGDTVMLNNSRLGWEGKTFRIEEWKFATRGSGDSPQLGIDIYCRETAPGIYDWNSGEETLGDLTPNTTLPDAHFLIAPTELALTSGLNDLLLPGDGTIISRIKATWTDSTGGIVSHYKIQYKKSVDSEYQNAGTSFPGAQEFYIVPVEDASAYDVRIQAVNVAGGKSTWDTVLNHTVIGKTAPPEDVQNFFANSPSAGIVTYSWDAVSDVDLFGYELRYGTQGAFVWSSGLSITKKTKGTLVTNTALPPGNWTIGIKAVDTSGNESVNVATFNIAVLNGNDIIISEEYAPRWVGVKTNFIRHDVSGTLIPDSQDLAIDLIRSAGFSAKFNKRSDGSLGAISIYPNPENFLENDIVRLSSTGTLPAPLLADTDYCILKLNIGTPFVALQIDISCLIISAGNYNNLTTGDAVTLTGSFTGTLPAPLQTGTTYYILKNNNNRICFFPTKTDAIANNSELIEFTNEGTGTISIFPANGPPSWHLAPCPATDAGQIALINNGGGTHTITKQVFTPDPVGNDSIFDKLTINPFPVCTYEPAEVDIGHDSIGVRAWVGNYLADLGPGENGKADPIFSLDYRLSADVYDGLEVWKVGRLNARYVKFQAKIETGTGVAFIKGFNPVLDIQERNEEGTVNTVFITGTAVAFSKRFNITPNIQITVQGSAAAYSVISNATNIGFIFKVFNSLGNEISGTINWTATGA